MNNQNVKTISIMGMLGALAFVSMALIHLKLVPSAPFLTYDPKDVVIVISGFIFGPLSSVILSVTVSFIEMLTVSESGIIGFLMQILATLSFSLTAAVIYKRKRTKKTACIGLIAGTVVMCITMLFWNYLMTPIYTGMPREAIVPLLFAAIIPFNLIKGLVNAILTLLLYKPFVNALRRSGMLPER